MITVECPHCERTIVGSDKFAGQYRECPGCSELFVALPVDRTRTSGTDVADSSADVDEILLPRTRHQDASHQRSTSIDSSPAFSSHNVAASKSTTGSESVDSADPLVPSVDIRCDVEEDTQEAEQSTSIWRRTLQSKESRSYVISTALHAVILLVLAVWILPQLPDTKLPGIITVMPHTEVDSSVETVDFNTQPQEEHLPLPIEPVAIADVAPVTEPNVSIATETEAKPPEGETDERNERVETARSVNASSMSEPGEAKVSQAKSVEGATDQIIQSIKSKLLEGDTLVMWLMDRSVSMQRQRNVMADRLEGYLNSVYEDRKDESNELMHIVVAFGARAEKLTVTNAPRKALAAIRKDYGLDSSGLENVFTAIEWSEEQFVQKNSRNRSKNLMCVVCTDESGDDYLRLERTIGICRKSRIEVSVIGPSAVLGQMQGFHSYKANDNRVYYLPVVRGPDTALRQRLNLPYWFRNVPFNWDESKRGPWYGNSPPWQGGSNLDAMLSGFGPYALTRLTMATGGDYILYDRPGDAAPFRLDVLRPYLPDYRAAEMILADLQDQPLRKTVLKTVEAAHKLKLQSPRIDYGVRFGGSFFYTPQQFRSRLRGELNSEMNRAERAVRELEVLIGLFEDRATESRYDRETSPRWKAWYDLTYGRLLAARIRYQGFAKFVDDLVPSRLKPTTNGFTIRPTRLSRSVEQSSRAIDAQRVLTRCMESHPETPWYYLAQRELATEFGFAIQERAVPPARRTGGIRGTRRTQVSLPRL